MEDVTLGLAFIAGLLSFVSPCVLPLVPAYIGYMGGRMTHDIALETGKSKIDTPSKTVADRAGLLLHGLFFVLGFTVVFVAIGVATSALVGVLGGTVNVLTDIIGRVGGVVIIFFGLHFMGALRSVFAWLKGRPGLLDNILTTLVVAVLGTLLLLWGFVQPLLALPFVAAFLLWIVLGGGLSAPGEFWNKTIDSLQTLLYSDTRMELQGKSSGLGGSFVMGVVFSAGWTPCIGPLLGTILTVAAQTGEIGVAVPMLTAYSLGLGIPFMLTAGLLESAQVVLRRLQKYMHQIEVFSGVLLVLIGVMVASGQLQALSSQLSTADVSYRIEECGLGFFEGELAFNQVGSCVGGTLVPLAVGQSHRAELNAEAAELEFVFHAQGEMAVDVELSNLEAVVPITLVLTNAQGEEIARSSEVTLVEEDDYLGMDDVMLPGAGQYTVTVTLDDTAAETNFRIKIVEEENPTLDTTEGAVDDVDSITDLAEQSGPPVGLQAGNRAPNFQVSTIDGEDISLYDLRGQVVLLNFWGTWCGPCRREMPEFQNIYEEYAEEGFTILALAVNDTEADVLDFQEEFGLTFSLAVDEGNVVNDQYAVVSQPSTFIIDPDGIILSRNFGLMLESQVLEVIEPVLNS